MNIKRFIDRPVLSVVISVFIVLLGIIALTKLPIEKFPDIAPPTIIVSAEYPGASADAIQKAVVAPLEEAINGVENMLYIESTASNTGTAEVKVIFRQGTNPDMAQVFVQNRVAQATGLLPAEVSKIGVTTFKEQPSILRTFALYSPDDSFDEAFIANYIHINIKPQMLRISGVGTVMVMGGEYAMRVKLNPSKMAQYGLVPADIVGVLEEQNIEAATGSLGENYDQTFRYSMKYRGRKVEESEFREMVITTLPTGEVLRLGDIAEIELGLSNYNYKGLVDGHVGVGVLVYQTAGSNATQINRKIDQLFAQVESDLPKGLRLVSMENSNDFLFASMKNVVWSLVLAIVLVVLVVYFFLHDIRATLVPTIGIVVSLVGTFAFIYAAGFSLNLLTLFALVLVIGTVVDNSIVVVEAVQARLDAGYKSAYQASVDAMNGLTTALFTTTLVFMVVFIPVSFIGGTMGVFYRQCGLTMAVAVGISFLSAITLSPALCALLLSDAENTKTNPLSLRIRKAYNVSYNALTARYSKTVERFIGSKGLLWGSLVLSTLLLVYLMRTTKTGLVPDEDTGVLYVDVSTPPGSGVEYTAHVMQKLDSCLRTIPEIEITNGISGEGLISGTGANIGMVIVKLKPWQERKGKAHSDQAVIDKIYAATADIHDAELFVMAPGMIDGYGAGDGFELHVQDRQGGTIQE
ncbi:MAG: efflux RND transporter permease subunit [Paludibacteraceae bacterium]